MTAHAHPVPDVTTRRSAAEPAPPPRWLIPALIGVPLVGALLAFGLLSPMALVYFGLFGGCLLMHFVGGHGGHGVHGGGASHDRSAHAGSETGVGEEDLSSRSSGSQPLGAPSSSELGERAPDDISNTNETERHDQHSSHGCH